MPSLSNFINRETRIFQVGGTAFLTLVINGSTAGPLLQKLGLAKSTSTRHKILQLFRKDYLNKTIDILLFLLKDERLGSARITKVIEHLGYIDDQGKHFDLTEDVPTTQFIQELSKTGNSVMAPQCGLAPGIIGIIGKDLTLSFDTLRDIELRVGALPRYPNGQLAYSFTWSPHGVINEYINDAEAIHNGQKKNVPSLEGFEYINIEGQEFEAFTTSGGLGTLCDTFEGKVDTLNYKTIRYPGHGKLMRFLIYELILKNDKDQLEKILSNAKPPVEEDVVYIYAVVEGWNNKVLSRKEYYKAFYPIEISGKKCSLTA